MRTPLTIVLAAAALVLGAGLGLLGASVCGQPSSVVVQFGDSPASTGSMRVYVSGAVTNPGVYPLRQGDRVVDAVQAAGGPAADADTEAVNFAERVQDGQHLRVPRIGDPPEAPDLQTASAGEQLVDINRADVNLLRSLPGLGATRAANIVDSRQKAGPFLRPEDLLTRKLVTQSVFDQVKPLITVGP
jgi:competence protein ComEA